MEASAARIRPAAARRARLKLRSHPQTPGSDPQPPALARSLQAGGHRFDPGWLHRGKRLYVNVFLALRAPALGRLGRQQIDPFARIRSALDVLALVLRGAVQLTGGPKQGF